MKKELYFLSFLIFFSGCSQVYLSKPNMTDEQFKKDKEYCEYVALKQVPTSTGNDKYGIEQALAKRDIIIKCMEVEKGYKSFTNREEAIKYRNSNKEEK